MFRLILICCILGGGLSQEYGLPATGVSGEVYSQPQSGGQIQSQAQNGNQIQNQDNALQSPPGPEELQQPYPAPEAIQQGLPYQGPSQIQQEVPQQLPQVQDVVQLAEAPQQPAETYGLPPSGQGSDVSLDHPPDEEPQQVVLLAEPPSPPAQPSEVYGLPPDGQSLARPRQYYTTGISYQKYQLNPFFQNQQGVYREENQRYADTDDTGSQYPAQYQKYPNQDQKYPEQHQQRRVYMGQYHQSINQFRPIVRYQNQNTQGIRYPNQYQRYNQDQGIGQYQKNQQQQQSYRESNVPSQSRNSYQNYHQPPKYTSQLYSQGSQYNRNPTQYQQSDQIRQYSTPNRQDQPSLSRQQQQQQQYQQQQQQPHQQQQQQPYPGPQPDRHISSQFETNNYISHTPPKVNDYSTPTPGTSVSTHLSRGYEHVQTSQVPTRYILLFQRNQAEGTPESSSVSYLSHPIGQRQRSKIQEVDSLPKLIELDEAPIVLPVPQNFHRGSSHGSASSTLVSKDVPGYDQQQNRYDQQQNRYDQQLNMYDQTQNSLNGFRSDGGQQVNSADVSSQFPASQQNTVYGQPSA